MTNPAHLSYMEFLQYVYTISLRLTPEIIIKQLIELQDVHVTIKLNHLSNFITQVSI